MSVGRTLAAFVDGALSAIRATGNRASCGGLSHVRRAPGAVVQSRARQFSATLTRRRISGGAPGPGWLPVAASLVVAAVWVSLPREAQMPSAEVDCVSTAAPPPAPQRPAATPAAAAAPASAGSVAETKAAPASSAVGGVAPKERKTTVPARSARVSLQAAPEVVGQRLDRPPQMLAQTPPPPTCRQQRAEAAVRRPQRQGG